MQHLLSVFSWKLPDQWDPHGSPQANLSGPVLPPGTPFPNQPQHRTSVPDSTEGYDLNKPDPYDLYEKSRAIYESRRECWNFTRLRALLCYNCQKTLWFEIVKNRRPLMSASAFQVQSMKRWRCTCWGRRLGSASASLGETRPCRLWVRTPVTRLVWDGLDHTHI